MSLCRQSLGAILPPESRPFADAMLEALTRRPKQISPKWLYDERGSQLFEAITACPEYYPTRTELSILDHTATDIVAFLGPQTELVEYGAGSVCKVDRLIQQMAEARTYHCVEIEASAAEATLALLRERFPSLALSCVIGDFTTNLPPLPKLPQGRYAGFFPGSTLGNFHPDEARRLLRLFRAQLGPEARFILGLDRVKPMPVLLAAYDDPVGITAEFNLNLLTRANRELSADFDLGNYRHSARWNIRLQRMEMHIVSLGSQRVRLCGRSFHFEPGETLHTECSYKFTDASIEQLLSDSGWVLRQQWTDAEGWFSLLGLEAL